MLKFSQDNPQNNFLNFLTIKNIFIPWYIFEIDIRGMFLEYSENITSRLLELKMNICYYQVIHFKRKKQLFHRELFKKSFHVKWSLIIPGCPEHCNAEETLSEYSRNIASRLGMC